MKNKHQIANCSFLTIASLLSLVCYHTYNFYSSQTFNAREVWKKSLLSFDYGKEIKLSFTLLKERERRQTADGSEFTLKGIGYFLKYCFSQFPSFIFSGLPSKYLQLSDRGEIYYQFPEAIPELKKRGAEVARYIEKLNRHGVTVLFIPIPSKLGFERKSYLPHLPSDKLWQKGEVDPGFRKSDENSKAVYYSFLNELTNAKLDGYELFENFQKQFPNDYIYRPDDSHWTSLTIALMAREIYSKLNPTIPISDLPILKLSEYKSGGGVLMENLQIPEFLRSEANGLSWKMPLYTLVSKVEPKISKERLILVGTSFAGHIDNTQYCLRALLAKVFKREIIYAAQGNFKLTGGLTQLKSQGFKFKANDILIWETPIFHIASPPIIGLPEIEFE